MTDASTEEPQRPLLRVVRGDPTPEELAALVAVVAAHAAAAGAGAGAGTTSPPAPSPWSGRAAALRQSPYPGPGAWRASAGLPGTRTRADW